MLYVFRVKKSLSDLGIKPSNVPLDYRQMMQSVGRGYGFTPQETALFIASQTPAVLRKNLDRNRVLNWILGGKINLREPAVLGMMAELDLAYMVKGLRERNLVSS